MELNEIVEKMAKALIVVDSATKTQRTSRSGSGDYISCVGTIWEDDFTQEAVIRWALNYPGDFSGFSDDWFEEYMWKQDKLYLSMMF
ncbi:MAG: hypothetical protein HOM47_01955 [Euryarchaeota archaeon]|jgi:hypothetical protein|nr:hypothetical protein [Euryarchaeota archaeon]